MEKYIKKFVTGHGIKFDAVYKNSQAAERCAIQWEEISENLKITSESIVMFCGAKNVGKSSLTRYVLNRYNRSKKSQSSSSADKYAYYVDFDPGQPEMTTPGVVSAHIIRSEAEPLTCPTYLNLNQHKPLIVSSVGGLNVSVNPRMYIDSCRYIFDSVKEHRSKEAREAPVFINTMGYIRNVGLAILIDLIKICAPSNLVILNIPDDFSRSINADLNPTIITDTRASFYNESCDNQTTLDYNCEIYDLEFAFVDSSSMATKNRAALQIAYFGLVPECLYKPVMQLEPKWLRLDSVFLYCVSSYPLKEKIVLEILDQSWVHLVKLKETTNAMRISPEEERMGKVIDDAGRNNLIGCAIVMKVDPIERRVAIVTPLSQKELDEEVNCIIKPLAMQIPREFVK